MTRSFTQKRPIFPIWPAPGIWSIRYESFVFSVQHHTAPPGGRI